MTLTFGSPFTGLGGIDLGLERAGMECRWQIEIDPFCNRVLAGRWPHVRRYGDIKEIFGDELEPVDVIAGGFPCQPVSLAGKGKAQEDARWLWEDFERIIRSVEPSYVVVENVPGLAQRGLSIVLGSLANLGFDAEWTCISAASVGAPHLRDRLFVVAYAQRLKLWEQSGGSSRENGQGAPIFADDGSAGIVANADPFGRDRWTRYLGPQGGSEFADSCSTWAVEPNVGRVAHGVPQRVDRLKALGNAVVPQVAEFVGRRIMAVAS